VPARLAFPDASGGVGIDGRALAPWAECRPAVVRESDRYEPGMGFIIAHLHNGLEAQGPCTGGKEEMLSHLTTNEKR
jgi:hypothetical protein